MSIDMIGPGVRTHKVALDGYVVPRLTANPIDAQQTKWEIVLDGRFGAEFDHDELERVVWLIANAMAIGEGYSCFGENSVVANPYKRQAIGIGSLEELRDGNEGQNLPSD